MATPIKLSEKHLTWYQTESSVVVSLLGRHLTSLELVIDKLTIDIAADFVLIKQAEPPKAVLIELAQEVNASDSKWQRVGAKIEITLKKTIGGQWAKVLKPNEAAVQDQGEPKPPVKLVNDRERELAAMIKEVEKEEEEHKGADSLFKSLYAGADDDARRAMMKSMQESGGRSLSMSWNEAEKKNYANDYDSDGELKSTRHGGRSDSDSD